MKDQNPRPKMPRKIQRIVLPRSPDAARARAVRSFGMSRCPVDGSGSRSAGAARDTSCAMIDCAIVGTRALCVEDVDERAGGVLAREPQKDLLEAFRTRMRARAQLRHRAEGADDAALNDADAVAHRFSDFERVRRHHDGMAAI